MAFSLRKILCLTLCAALLGFGSVSTSANARETWGTMVFEIENGWNAVDVGLPLPVEDVAVVTVPTQKGRVAPGSHPVVLLLHGQHNFCYASSDVPNLVPNPVPAWCSDPAELTPVPSHMGYQYLAKDIAREGNIVISISANGINGQANANNAVEMTARAALVEYHLGALAAANSGSQQGYGSRLVGHVNSRSTVLMGHSRGGEGVMHAAQSINGSRDSRLSIKGVLNFAPVNNSQQAVGNIPVATLLPACDGDVSNQIGQSYVDRARDLYGYWAQLQSAVWMPGGNHNYLNTEWTPGSSISNTGADDALYEYADPSVDGSCKAELRLTPGEERIVGRDYLRAFNRMIQGGKNSDVSFFDGSGKVPSATKKLGIDMRSSSFGGPDSLILVPTPDTDLEASGAKTFICNGSNLSSIQKVCASGFANVGVGFSNANQATAWLTNGAYPPLLLPTRFAVQTQWEGPGTAWASFDEVKDLSGATHVSSRVVVSSPAPADLVLVLRDESGSEAQLQPTVKSHAVTSHGLAFRMWPQSIVSELTQTGPLDLKRITHVGLRASGPGDAWLLDVSARNPNRPKSTKLLPAASLTDLTVTKGPGESTSQVRVSLDTPAGEGGTFAYVISHGGEVVKPQSGVGTVTPGARFASIPVSVSMPETSTGPTLAKVNFYPLSGMSVADSESRLIVLPIGVAIPTARIIQAQAAAPAGSVLTWTIRAAEDVLDASFEAMFVDQDIPREYEEQFLELNPHIYLEGRRVYAPFDQMSNGEFKLSLALPSGIPAGTYFELEVLPRGALITNPSELVGWVSQ